MTQTHDALREAATAALGHAARFFLQQTIEGSGFRFGPSHDVARWPSMVLPGTYNAVMGLRLLGHDFTDQERDRLAAVIRSFALPDGAFRMPQMTPQDVFKKPDADETWRYLDFHLSNYALGGMEALDRLDGVRFDFVRPFLQPQFLEAWLARRDLRDPWLEGNNLVNLGSFLLLLAHHGDADDRDRAGHALDLVMDWHARNQEPSTGFWGVGQHHDPRQRLHAMAGATHDYHLYYALGRPIPSIERAVDYCLGLPPDIVSACIDVDTIDILVHAAVRSAYRVDEVRAWCERWVRRIVAVQNPDGGFFDERQGILRFDGWVGGYWEPQGGSNTFATWFRCIAMAMCARLLWPDMRFGFRRMIGIGYARLGAGAHEVA